MRRQRNRKDGLLINKSYNHMNAQTKWRPTRNWKQKKTYNDISIMVALSLLAHGATWLVLQLMRQKAREENVVVGRGNEVCGD